MRDVRFDHIAIATRRMTDGPPELVGAVRAVMAGDVPLSASVTRRVLELFSRHAGQPSPVPELQRLTDRERDVFDLVARGRTNEEIAAELYLGVTTVKTHVGRVLAKLGLRDRVHAVVYAYERGIITPGR